MDAENKDYAFKNEISLSIGGDSVDSAVSTPSTVTPSGPTPSPRQNMADDKKPLRKNAGNMLKPEGIDNRAFETVEKATPSKLLSSFGNGHNNNFNDSGANSANKNGQSNEKKLAEAVNLELININSNNNGTKPTTTNGKHNNNELTEKKDGDVEIGNTKDDSYDEYFVPVNKHRKYMGFSKSRKLHGVDINGLSLETPEYGIVRYSDWIHGTSRGEKLYVTQDKRAKTQKNKLCWIICIGLVAAVIILGILAASGAFSKSDSPIEARNLKSTENDTLAVAGFASPNKKNYTDSTTTLSTTTEATLPPILDTTPPLPPNDNILYVPNTLEGQITLSNAKYSNEYNDANSPIHKKFIRDLENEIKNALSEKGDEEFFIKIIGLKSGSVVVDYRISWKNPNSEISSEEMMNRIQNFLNKNNYQFMGRYLVNLNTVRTARVPDRCASPDKNSCDYGCKFSAKLVDFECTCPQNQKYDTDFKECVNDNDSIFSDESSSVEPGPQPNKYDHDRDHDHQDHEYHTYDTTSEPSSELNSESEPSSELKSEPEPTNEPKAKSEETSEPNSEPVPSSEPKSVPEPTSDRKLDEQEIYIRDHTHVRVETTSEHLSSELLIEPALEVEPTGKPKLEPVSTSEPKSNDRDPQIHDHLYVYVETTNKPTSDPSRNPMSESKPPSEHKSEPEPTSEPKSNEHDTHILDHLYDFMETTSKLSFEPSNEPKPETEPTSEQKLNNQQNIKTSSGPLTDDPSSSSVPISDDKMTATETFYKEDRNLKVLNEVYGEKSTTRSKPVNEDYEDTLRPTENYFAISRSKDLKSEINVFNSNSTTKSSENITVYSTATPIHLWTSDNATQAEHGNESHDMSPFLPEAENANLKAGVKIYSVTENVSEVEAPHNQSPFLPELENNETLHHILHGGHGMISEEYDETNKSLSITVSYSNDINTDSPIINVVPLSIETSTQSSPNVLTTVASETQTTMKVSKGESISKTTGGQSSTQESSVSQDSTETTTIKDKSDDDDEHGEDDSLNLFGEIFDERDKNESQMSSTTPNAKITTTTNDTETTKPETHIQNLLTIQPSLESTVQESASTTPVVPSTTTVEAQSTSKRALISSKPPVQATTTEKLIVLSEQPSSDSTTTVPETNQTFSSFSHLESSTTVYVHIQESEEDLNSKITLNDFKQFDSDSDNSLKVIPLSYRESSSTTSESNKFANQNVSDEASLNFRNGKILPDNFFIKANEDKNQQSLETDKKDKNKLNKLFKQEFHDELNITNTRPSCSDKQFKCVLSNECILKSKICDGKDQCADHSDEWNCFYLSNNFKVLQFKQEEKLFKVCATNWTNDLSNKVCNKLGFSGADGWVNNKDIVSKEEKYLVLEKGALGSFVFVDSCDDGLVEIQCAHYECGSNSSSTVDSGEFSSISLVVNRDSTLRCTASIISPLWALTSSSCVSQPNQEWILIAGSTELNMSKISKDSVISLIGNVVTYPDLKQVLSFANQIYSTCLNVKQKESEKECLTTGWLNKSSNNSYEKYEKIAAVDRNCTSQTNSICVTPQNRLSSECYIDKGAALYCYSESHSRWLLNGIRDKENDCEDIAEPSIFSSFSSNIVEWIKNTVGNSRMFV